MALGRCITPLIAIVAVLVLVVEGTGGGKGNAALMDAADNGGGKALLIDISVVVVVMFVSVEGCIDKDVLAGLLFDNPLDFFDPSVSIIPSLEKDEDDDEGTMDCPLVTAAGPFVKSSTEPLLLLVVNCDGARLTNEKASILPLIMVKLPTSLLVIKEVSSTRLGRSRYFMITKN